MKDSKNLFKKLSLIGFGLCAACCLLPIAAVTFGLGTLTALSVYMGWASIAAMTLAALFYAIRYFRKRNSRACDVDCSSKEKAALSSSKR